MHFGVQSEIVRITIELLYLAAAVYMVFLKRWPLRAGLVLTLLSNAYTSQFPDSDARLLLMFLLPVSLLLIVWGVIAAATRGVRYILRKRTA